MITEFQEIYIYNEKTSAYRSSMFKFAAKLTKIIKTSEKCLAIGNSRYDL